MVLVDDEDYDWLNEYKWYISTHGYAITNIKINNKQIGTKMHRLIMNEPKNMEIDHIDGNKLYNCKNNLRIVTHHQNRMNRKSYKNSTSKFKGVNWCKATNKWQSQIRFNNKKIFLGRFINEKDAAKAYNERAKELFKEYAYLNEV